MRLLHTSDWHLGHTLHNFPREYEHACFLSWLLRTLEQEAIDALLVSGDIFDSSNPPTWALEQYYGFLAAAIKQMPPHFQVVVVGGNHDSAARLNAPVPLLREMRIHVTGGVPRKKDGQLDVARLTVPLRNRSGQIAAWCAAMPFIRVSDLPPKKESDDPFVAGVRSLYGQLLDHVARKQSPDQALVVTGHCYMVDSRLSENSERKILGGNQHGLPRDLFPESVTYTALGHMHLAQIIDRRGAVRYAGSPIPLSFSEDNYKHAVCIVDLDGPNLGTVLEKPVPRAVAMTRLRHVPEAELDARLTELPALTPFGIEEERPLLEVSVCVDGPVPGMRQRIEQALEGKQPRLLKITLERREKEHRPLATAVPSATLGDMSPEAVFLRCYKHQRESDPPERLCSLFNELFESVSRGLP